MTLKVAGKRIALERVVDSMVRPQSHGGYPWQTLRWYDRGQGAERSPDRVTLADLGRVCVFGGGLRYDTARDHLRVSEQEDQLLTILPSNLWLHATEPGSDTWQAAYRTYMLYVRGGERGSGKRWAQAAKLLHLKRPGFFPVTDSRFETTYASVLNTMDGQAPRPHEWLAVQDDLIANGAAATLEQRDPSSAFAQLREGIAAARPQDEDDKVDDLLALTDLRLLDIAAWSLSD